MSGELLTPPVPRAGRPAPRPGSRRRAFKVLAAAGAAALTLLAGEAALRVRERFLLKSEPPSTWAGDYQAYLQVSHQADRMFVRDPADPLIPYKNRPGFSMELPLPSGQLWSCRINSLGFRGEEFAARKPAGTVRILCLGGSTTFWGYSDAETYPALLQKRLREAAAGRPLEVLNLGVSGYTSAMSAERFHRQYRAFSPDLVVVFHGVNDIMTLAPLRYRHRVARSLLLATAWNLAAACMEGGEGRGLAAEVEARFDGEFAPNYERLRREAKEVGARLLVLTFPGPDLERLEEKDRAFLRAELYRSWRELGSLEGYLGSLAAYNAKLRAWAERSGTPLLDLAERVRGGTDIFMDLCHMNTRGLERIAGEVASALKN